MAQVSGRTSANTVYGVDPNLCAQQHNIRDSTTFVIGIMLSLRRIVPALVNHSSFSSLAQMRRPAKNHMGL
jgi:hypothetical protein